MTYTPTNNSCPPSNYTVPTHTPAMPPPSPEEVRQLVAARYAVSALEHPINMEQVMTVVASISFDQLLRQQVVLEEEMNRGPLDLERLIQLKPLADQQLQLGRQIGRIADFMQRSEAARRKAAGRDQHPGQ